MLELNPPFRIRPVLEHLIQNTEVACLDGALPGGDTVALATKTQHLGGKLLAPLTDAVPHVLPRHSEEDSLLALAADHHVDMGMRGIEVLDGHPLKAEAQVAFHRRHELARVLPEVQSLAGFGRDDELPEARISGSLPPAEAIRDVDLLLMGVEAKARLSLLLGSFARQVAPMDTPAGPAAILHVPDLDDAQLQHGRGEAEEAHARGREASEPAPSATARGNRAQAARAGSPALTRNPPGAKPHLGALTFSVLHHTHPRELRSPDRSSGSRSASTSLDGSSGGSRPSARRSPSSSAGPRSRRSGTSRQSSMGIETVVLTRRSNALATSAIAPLIATRTSGQRRRCRHESVAHFHTTRLCVSWAKPQESGCKPATSRVNRVFPPEKISARVTNSGWN